MKKPHPVLSLAFAFVAVVIVSHSIATAAIAEVAPAALGSAVDATGSAVPTISPLPDPIENPTGSVDTITRLWRSGATPAALIVALYLIAVVVARRVPWFVEGKRAAYTAAALGMLTTLAEPATRGTTPSLSMGIAALATALALALSPTKPSDTVVGVIEGK